MSMNAAQGTPTRTIFYGFGAWVGRLDARTTCAFWADDPNNLRFAPGEFLVVDLAKNPAAYLAGTISLADVQVDDGPDDGGLTKLGPTWPTGSTINGAWLEQRFYENLPNRPPFPQRFMSAYPYELTTAIYWAGPRAVSQRFWGYHAKITGERGTLALCSIWTPGTAMAGGPPAGTWWIDLATQADPLANGLTAIGVGAEPKEGALFLDAPSARSLGLSGAKLPPYMGGEAIPLPEE